MNQRIQKLYKETTGKDWVYDFDPDYAGKFAELIIRECQRQVEQYIYECGEIASIPDTVIMKHFGVEE